MKLADWRKSQAMTQTALASRLECDVSSVSRYERDRIPPQEVMTRIVKVTGGAVTANDFYGIKAKAEETTAGSSP